MNQDCSQCSYYIENKKDIEATNERVSLMLDSIEQKIDNMAEINEMNFRKVEENVSQVDNRLTVVHSDLETKITNLNRNIPSMVDERIRNNTLSKAFNVMKWVVVSLGGSVLIAMTTAYFTRFI